MKLKDAPNREEMVVIGAVKIKEKDAAVAAGEAEDSTPRN